MHQAGDGCQGPWPLVVTPTGEVTPTSPTKDSSQGQWKEGALKSAIWPSEEAWWWTESCPALGLSFPVGQVTLLIPPSQIKVQTVKC